MSDGTIVAIRPGLEPSLATREPNNSVVEHLVELLEQAKAGEIVGIAYATLHPSDLSTYTTRGRTTRGLLGALVLLQHDMCVDNSENA